MGAPQEIVAIVACGTETELRAEVEAKRQECGAATGGGSGGKVAVNKHNTVGQSAALDSRCRRRRAAAAGLGALYKLRGVKVEHDAPRDWETLTF
eukprot:gene15135-biopygen5170